MVYEATCVVDKLSVDVVYEYDGGQGDGLPLIFDNGHCCAGVIRLAIVRPRRVLHSTLSSLHELAFFVLYNETEREGPLHEITITSSRSAAPRDVLFYLWFILNCPTQTRSIFTTLCYNHVPAFPIIIPPIFTISLPEFSLLPITITKYRWLSLQ